jgi:RimJ/RimL family protein N-acetyltransferase
MRLRLSSRRLVLTPEQPADAGWLADLFTARGTGIVTVEAARQRIEAMTKTLAASGIGAVVMRPREGSPPVGYCALVVGRASLAEPEIVYEVLPEAQGRGYATEASCALMDAAWDTGRDRLWATIRARNVASLRVADKLGFVHHHRSTDADGELLWFRCDR